MYVVIILIVAWLCKLTLPMMSSASWVLCAAVPGGSSLKRILIDPRAEDPYAWGCACMEEEAIRQHTRQHSQPYHVLPWLRSLRLQSMHIIAPRLTPILAVDQALYRLDRRPRYALHPARVYGHRRPLLQLAQH